jgi:hypothetical protein
MASLLVLHCRQCTACGAEGIPAHPGEGRLPTPDENRSWFPRDRRQGQLHGDEYGCGIPGSSWQVVHSSHPEEE